MEPICRNLSRHDDGTFGWLMGAPVQSASTEVMRMVPQTASYRIGMPLQ